MSEYAQINTKLKESLSHLPKTLKRAATYMLERPGDIATLSMRQVAVNSNVTLPNFGRLAKALGYTTYGEMRDIYRKQVQQGDITDYHLRAQNLQQSGDREGIENVWASFRDAAQASINEVYNSIDTAQIAMIADVLKSSRNIYVAGMQASRSAATYLNYIGGMASDQFKLVGRSGGIFADDITDLGKDDALIAIAAHPYAHVTVETTIIAKERNATVIAITDTPVSPIAINAAYLLLCPTKSPMFFQSYIGIIAVVEMLIGFYTIGQPSSVVDRIERVETERHRLGEYWESQG